MRETSSWLYIDPCEELSGMARMACEVAGAFRRLFDDGPASGQAIQISSCPVPYGTRVEYRHDERILCIDPDIARDCLSKRGLQADPGYNVGPLPNRESCQPSLGFWHEGRIYLSTGEEEGFNLLAQGDRMVGVRRPGMSAPGYGAVITSLIAHQLVHAYFMTTVGENRMAGWPYDDAALTEEILAHLAQSLTYYHLCRIGMCALDAGMREETFVREIMENNSGAVVGANPGTRYRYPPNCFGRGGIFLGPFCTNMLGMARWLEEGKWEWVRVMSLLQAKAPLLAMPEHVSINGRLEER